MGLLTGGCSGARLLQSDLVSRYDLRVRNDPHLIIWNARTAYPHLECLRMRCMVTVEAAFRHDRHHAYGKLERRTGSRGLPEAQSYLSLLVETNPAANW